MRKLVFLSIIIGLTISCVETKTTKNEIIKVNCFQRDGFLLLAKDSVTVFDTLSLILESNHRIINEYNDSLSFIAISSYGDAIFNYIGLFDSFGKPIINLVDTAHDWNTKIVPNPKYYSHSIDKKYYLIEGGTSSSIKTIQIFNENGVEVDRIKVVASLSENGYFWNKNNELIFFITNNYKGGMTVAEKVKWIDGKLIDTGEKQEIYLQ